MRFVKTELSKGNPYYISKHRLHELRHFCMQYDEWKKALNDISMIREQGDLGIDPGEVVDTVPNIVEQRNRYVNNIKLVEDCAKRTDAFLWKWILIGVTTDSSYENLRLLHGIACCRNKYYQMVRRFFYILSEFR